VAVATPEAMREVRTIARVLGPKGMMPNPKSGTVTDDIPAGIDEVKAGRVEFKMDKTANVAIVVGKRSFTSEKISENVDAAVKALVEARPKAAPAKYIKSLTLSATMSPGLSMDPAVYNKI
jgi:large subunit ribosomal protein L1